MNRRTFLSLLLGLLLFFGCGKSLQARGLGVYPAELMLTPGKAGHYMASNKADYPIAVVVLAETWVLDEDGEETSEVTDELMVYPKHFVLKKGQNRKIRVSSRERKPIQVEKTYRVTIREMPVSFKEEDQRGVYMAVAYRTACYLRPLRPRPQFHLRSAKVVDGALEVLIGNSGSAHAHVNKPRAVLKFPGRSVALDEAAVVKELGSENIHAKKQRRFRLPLPEDLDTTSLKSVTLRLEEETHPRQLSVPIQ